MSGWLALRFGVKRLLTLSVAGFMITSALCGAAQSLPQLVLFRILQGAFAAPLQPLSAAVILDLFSLAERGPIMAFWGMGVTAAPILGPVLGGYLTDAANWRWVFYINLPIGALCLLGVATFVPDAKPIRKRFDLRGFTLLSLALAAAQLMLDRGQGHGWFESSEIVVEAAIAAIAFWFFLVHSFTTPNPFVPLAIFKDANFMSSNTLIVLVALVTFSTAALMPSMLQNLFGYSVLDTGLIFSPRGVGSVISLLVVGRIVGRVNTHALLILGLATFAYSFYDMSTFTLDTPAWHMGLNALIQGLGSGCIMLPASTVAYATMQPYLRADASSISALTRNLGGAVGISILVAIQVNFAVGNRALLAAPYSADNATIHGYLPAPYSLTDPQGIAILSAEVDRQAAMVSYTHVYGIMALVVLLVSPVMFLLKPMQAIGAEQPMVSE